MSATSVVRGDRIAESKKLNTVIKGKRLSLAAFWSYAHFISILHDDYWRFRFDARIALTKVAPRRPDATVESVAEILDEYKRVNLLRVWTTSEGVDFAEWVVPSEFIKKSGRGYHHAPEPPWSNHRHDGWCLSTAIREAKRWGDPKTAKALSNRLKELRRGERDSSSSSSSSSSSIASPSLREGHSISSEELILTASVEKRNVFREAMDDWKERHGGTIPKALAVRITNAFKDLLGDVAQQQRCDQSTAWDRWIRELWREYLAATEPRFTSPENFAAKPYAHREQRGGEF